jgi:hypothetical protein
VELIGLIQSPSSFSGRGVVVPSPKAILRGGLFEPRRLKFCHRGFASCCMMRGAWPQYHAHRVAIPITPVKA